MYKAEELKNNNVFQFVSQDEARTRDGQNSSYLNLSHRRLLFCFRENRNMDLNL